MVHRCIHETGLRQGNRLRKSFVTLVEPIEPNLEKVHGPGFTTRELKLNY